MPCIKPLHSLLYWEWFLRKSLWHNFWRIVYYEPMFKSQCVSVGPGFLMEYAGNGSTRVIGDLQLHLGANVHIFDKTGFVGLKVCHKPELYIGDNTYISPSTQFLVGKKVTIGKNCMIGSSIITDNPGHSLDILKRLRADSFSPEDIRPVKIGDFCWLPLGTWVYPGVTIGDGVVALAGTHINRDVPPFCLVAGHPMVIVRKLHIPKELIDIVGKERYESYLTSHEGLDLKVGSK
jgi:acetyltransferase-like isoleucine patch superfamily enzyme